MAREPLPPTLRQAVSGRAGECYECYRRWARFATLRLLDGRNECAASNAASEVVCRRTGDSRPALKGALRYRAWDACHNPQTAQ